MQKITHTYLLGLKATGKIQRIPVGDALELRVSKTGKKSWYLRYDTLTPEGKRKQNIVTIGDFPAMGMKDARAEAENRKIQAKSANINLVAAKKEERLEKAQVSHTLQEVCDAWLDLKDKEWTSDKSKKQNRGRLSANIYPIIGHMPIDTITVADIDKALLYIIERGSVEVARRIHTMIAEIFNFAFSKGIVKDADVIVRLGIYKKSMPKRKKKKSHFEREMELEEIGLLALKIHEHAAGTYPVVMALKMAPYVAMRPSELLEAQWSEIDLERAEWRIPAARIEVAPFFKQVTALP